MVDRHSVSPMKLVTLLALSALASCSLYSDDNPQTEETQTDAMLAEAVAENETPEESLVADVAVTTGLFAEEDQPARLAIISPELRARLAKEGAYIVQAVTACGSCHGADPKDPSSPLSGGKLLQDRFGEVQAANITPDKETGIGGWGISDLKRVFRESYAPDGRPLSIDVHAQYGWLPDYEIKTITEYLLAQPAVSNALEKRMLGGFERRKYGLFSQWEELPGYVPKKDWRSPFHLGRYLATNAAGCATCHTGAEGMFSDKKILSGWGDDTVRADKKKETSWFGFGSSTEEPEAQPFPLPGPNIRGNAKAGLKKWSSDDIVNYLSSGMTPEKRQITADHCPWPYFARMKDEDKAAIAKFLKSL